MNKTILVVVLVVIIGVAIVAGAIYYLTLPPPPKTVRLAFPPLQLIGAIPKYMEEHGIWDKYGEMYGINFSIALSFEDTTWFAAREIDVAFMGPQEAAIYEEETQEDVTVFGATLSCSGGWVVRADSNYTKGSDFVGGKIGIVGWNDGIVPLGEYVLKTEDLSLLEDFDVHATDFVVLPQVLVNGEVDVAMMNPLISAVPYVVDGDLKFIEPGFCYDYENETGVLISVSMPTAHTDWLDDNPDAAKAIVEALEEGGKEFYKDLAGNMETYREMLVPGGELRDEDLEWAVWYIETHPMWASPVKLSQSTVDGLIDFLEINAELDIIEGGEHIQTLFRVID